MGEGASGSTVGSLLREWRKLRKLSQLKLGLQAGTSARHLSFVETGRAIPSRDMVLRLADHLDIPAPRRNSLLLAAGYAPIYEQPRPPAVSDATLAEIGQLLLLGREPYPSFVVDGAKNVVLTNQSVQVLLDEVDQALLTPPANLVRLALHPDGFVRVVTNWDDWRRNVQARLHRECVLTGDARLLALYEEVSRYPGAPVDDIEDDTDARALSRVMSPLCVRRPGGELRFLNVVTTFGTQAEVSVMELAVETFYPADAATAEFLHDRLGVPAGTPAPAAN